MEKCRIDSIKDCYGDSIELGVERIAGMETLYTCIPIMLEVSKSIEDVRRRSAMLSIVSKIKIAYFSELLNQDVVLDPIVLVNGRLKDGKHRLFAHVLMNRDYINFIDIG